MEKITVNAKGLSCPQPVLETKKAITAHGDAKEIEILVDTVTSRENVCRFAHKNGYNTETKQLEDGFSVLLSK